MAKSRIIIADTDINYILPLQLKFAEDYFEQVDLEIITDRDYFTALFATPQKADILVVSETLYDASLLRHDIGSLFLMTERFDSGKTAELRVNQIYKYTSIKEIFNEIIGKSPVVSTGGKGVGQTRVILVYSAGGGTGKTTVSMGIAAALTQNYKKVLYLNTARLQTFAYALENKTPLMGEAVYADLRAGGADLYDKIKHVIRQELFYYLPPWKAAMLSLGLPECVYATLVESAKASGRYDFIVVDADPVFDEAKAQLLDLADRVLLVTTQSRAAVYATNLLLSNINNSTSEKYLFICNDFQPDADNALLSTDTAPKFSVSEYIYHIPHCAQRAPAELAKESGIQKTAFLVL